MSYNRILTIQDISCVGQCSMTVALPILSACGQETAILPSAVLSTHTGGFSGFTFRDLAEDMPGIRQHWEKEGIKFEAIYTGYLGGVKQIDYTIDIIDNCLNENGKIVIDPAMADNGKLYYGFDEEYVSAMRRLCAKADVILPNVTEACFLTGTEYREKYDEEYIKELLDKLMALGTKSVLMTGVSYSEDTTGVLLYDGKEQDYYRHVKLKKSYHGTGDIYSSAFVGALASGKTAGEAARIAADYTVDCIRITMDDDSHWYGVKFEAAIPGLVKALN
ncbi:MAG: pyridoxamine kinase [Clostridia bacterium]|nr:pyridoxamine kinase [Clostridia bacterium]